MSDSDIVRFTGVLGPDTSGSFSVFFDGSDVGLGGTWRSSEGIDAVSVDAAGDLYLSTTGSFSVSGVSGGDEDVFRFTPTSLGSTTAGAFQLFLDGSTVGLTANITALDAAGGFGPPQNVAPVVSVSAVPPMAGLNHISMTTCRIAEMMTAAEVPQMNAKISNRGGSGANRSSHR